MARRAVQFFTSNTGRGIVEKEISALTGALNTTDSEFDVEDSELTGGQNAVPASQTSVKKRGGIQLVGNFLGNATGILSGFSFVNRGGTQTDLITYDTGLYYLSSNTWTNIAGVTLTTNKPGDWAYFPSTNKAYYVNQTDSVVKVTSSASVDQSDSNFKKGKYIIARKSRLLVANLTGGEDQVWYTDTGVDTFSANNYFIVDGAVTGLLNFYDKIMVSTQNQLFRVANFTFDAGGTYPESVDPIPVDFGTIYDRTMCVVNGRIYFLGLDNEGVCELYESDGYQVRPIGDERIRRTLDSLNAAQLGGACAVAAGNSYKLYVPGTGDTTNTVGLTFDTVRRKFYTPEARFVEGLADFSCLWSVKSSGQMYVYGGTQSYGQVYKLEANDGLYDELPEEYQLSGSTDIAIDANPAKRAAQSFQLDNYNETQTVPVTKVAVKLKKNTGTTTDLQVRIETDNNGQPSGTAVTNGTVTLSAFSGTTYEWKTVSFSTAPELNGSTTYWLVIQHVTEGSGTSQYYWAANSSDNYADGNTSNYSTGLTSSSNTFNSSSSAISGTVYRETALTGESYSAIRTGAGTFIELNPVIVTLYAGSNTDTWSSHTRGIVLFDTSALPDDATVTSATLQMYCEFSNFADHGIGITSASPASNTTLVEDDYDVDDFGSTRLATDVNINTLSTGAYNTWTLNASGLSAISLTGITKFGMRLESDIDNSAPTWSLNRYFQAEFQGYNNTNKPRLVVNYTTAGVAGWAADEDKDQTMVFYAQSPIDMYFDTKAHLPNDGKEYQLHRFQSVFNTVGAYMAEVGFSRGDYGTFQNFAVDLSGETNALWGTATWGQFTWGGQATRNYDWTEVDDFVGRTLKVRIRNRNANEQVEFDRLMVALSPRLRHN